ncbi:hypothetical protein RF11_03921 [Thelohanellus kitauei]|uniref:EGF-like domain-containing protein n=1 Tax=Thelohanellus kitauei TaxID=669202 RepID=A0A0C2MRH4_THEKT|nr:hypothetical protein RF11_03921 [Thelohanellus kitauei]
MIFAILSITFLFADCQTDQKKFVLFSILDWKCIEEESKTNPCGSETRYFYLHYESLDSNKIKDEVFKITLADQKLKEGSKTYYIELVDFFTSEYSNPCDKNPCKKGTCVSKNMKNSSMFNDHKNSPLTFECSCEDKYFGNHCSHKSYCLNCKSGQCLGAGLCQSCVPGWEGPDCQTVSCNKLKMCMNDGKCYVKDNRRFCACSSFWGGKYCQIELRIAKKVAKATGSLVVLAVLILFIMAVIFQDTVSYYFAYFTNPSFREFVRYHHDELDWKCTGKESKNTECSSENLYFYLHYRTGEKLTKTEIFKILFTNNEISKESQLHFSAILDFKDGASDIVANLVFPSNIVIPDLIMMFLFEKSNLTEDNNLARMTLLLQALAQIYHDYACPLSSWTAAITSSNMKVETGVISVYNTSVLDKGVPNQRRIKPLLRSQKTTVGVRFEN